MSKLKELWEKYQALKVKVVEAVQLVEKEFKGKSGEEKREAAIHIMDDLIKLPLYLEWADNVLIGWLVDLAVEKLNFFSDWMFGKEETPEVDAGRMAGILEANVYDMDAARNATPGQDVNARIEALYQKYGIATDGPPAPTVPDKPQTPATDKKPAPDAWERAIRFVGIAEGGKNFTEVNGKAVLKPSAKNDKGGPTAYGVTQGTLSAAYAKNIVQHNDITKLTRDEAKYIFRANYWDRYGWGAFPWPICLILFDVTIHHGPGGMAKIAQRACTSYGYKPDLLIDGKWGPKTKQAVLDISRTAPGELARLMLLHRKEFFDAIIQRDPRQEGFRKGWYNRIKNIAKASGIVSPV